MYNLKRILIVVGSILFVLKGTQSFAIDDFVHIQSSEKPELNTLINKSLIKIFKTQLGQSIAEKILHCEPEAAVQHLGVDPKSAKIIMSNCKLSTSYYESLSNHSLFIRPSPLKVLNKTYDPNKTSEPNKRTYSFLFTTKNNWLIDSWTNSATNNTSIVVPKNKSGIIIDESRLIEILAHETAIYFDSKFWAGATGFNKTPGVTQFYKKFNVRNDEVQLALDNPLIAHSLAFIRAFKIEVNITTELERLKLISFDNESTYRRQQKIQSFLSCQALCLHKFIESQAKLINHMSLPLMAYSPSYRVRLWSYLTYQTFNVPEEYKLPEKLSYKNIILDLPHQFYLDHLDQDIHLILESINEPAINLSAFSSLENFNDFMSSAILPVHFNDLANQKDPIVHGSALDFMATPLLSGYNTRMSSGPRPRIIVGGF